MTVLGINIEAYVHVIAAAAGLSALFSAVPVAYTVVKLVGAPYLIWNLSIRLCLWPLTMVVAIR